MTSVLSTLGRYATIEADIDALEAAAVKAEAELEAAKLARPRLPLT